MNSELNHQLATLVLSTSRIAGMVMVVPMPWSQAPGRFRAFMILVLAVIAHSATPDMTQPLSIDAAVLALPMEVLLGAAIGFFARGAFAVAEIAGDTVSPLFGLGAAAMFDPLTSSSATPLTRMLVLLSTLLAVIAGVHRAILGAILMSFQVVKPGFVVDLRPTLPALIHVASMTLEVGVRVAFPILAMLLLTQVALAFVSRAAPTMQIFSVGFAVSTSVGFALLIISLPDMGRLVLHDLMQVPARIDGFLYLVTR